MTETQDIHVAARRWSVSGIRILVFGFVSDFGIRISSLGISVAIIIVFAVWPAESPELDIHSTAKQRSIDAAAIAAPPASRRIYIDPNVRLCQWREVTGRPACAAPHHPWAHAGFGHKPPFGQGAYVRPGRMAHVPAYRLRVDDQLELVYRRTRNQSAREYKLNVGDQIRVELLEENAVNRELVIQPDGTITLPLLGQVPAAGQTIPLLKLLLEKEYGKYYKVPVVTVTPLQTNVKLIDIINSVDSRAGEGGQVRRARVAPDGTIALPAVGTVPVQGLTLEELKVELDARYAIEVDGIEVQPILERRAQRFVYVLGEVRQPGRFVLEGPTTVIQAVTLAGGVTNAAAANLEQVVVFRRTPDWRLIATMLDLYGPVVRGADCDVQDVWVSDADIIIVPKSKILIFDEFVEMIFARGVYGIIPMQGISFGFSKNSTL